MSDKRDLLEIVLREIRAVRDSADQRFGGIERTLGELRGELSAQKTLLQELRSSHEDQTGEISRLQLERVRQPAPSPSEEAAAAPWYVSVAQGLPPVAWLAASTAVVAVVMTLAWSGYLGPLIAKLGS
jgi:hypothetical protein